MNDNDSLRDMAQTWTKLTLNI